MGDVVAMADGGLAVVTGARWTPGPPADWPPAAYRGTPATGGPRELEIPAESLTAVPTKTDDHGNDGRRGDDRPGFTFALALAEPRAEHQARQDAENAAGGPVGKAVVEGSDAPARCTRSWRACRTRNVAVGVRALGPGVLLLPLSAGRSDRRPALARVGVRSSPARRVLGDVQTRQACERVPDEIGIVDRLG
ncbi:hypothetical protein [Spirillospora sp. CA-128828]|uniref:hypothetical protein n=1 Tax=Spirillospora sp. CA-128828 TaxID=3240033 RepID=UPI003D94F556